MELIVDKGIVRLYDGTVVYIVEIQYSSNGINYWESTYNSSNHIYEGDGVTQLGPHKYMRIRHAGDTDFQMPIYITATDGDSPELRVSDNKIQWKLSEEEVWIELVDLDDLKGPQGDEGPAGEGLYINGAGALDDRPTCCNTSTTSGCGCGGTSSGVTTSVSTFLSLGNHLISTNDIGTYHTLETDNTNWVLTTQQHVDDRVYAVGWGATADVDANTDASTVNDLGQTVLYSAVAVVDTSGRLYACANQEWSNKLDFTITSGQVKVSANDTLGLLETKVDGTTIESYDSGVGYNDNIRVADDGINEFKIISSTFDDGLTGGSGTDVSVVPGDFVGTESHGLETFTHTDTTTDIRVEPDDLDGDGIKLEGTSPTQTLAVDVNDLVIDTTDGLEVYTAGDTFDNIRVKVGDAISLSGSIVGGVNVVGDELTIQASALSAIQVAPTDNATLGIQAKHLHSNTANNNAGLQKGAALTDPLEVKVDGTTIGFNGTGQVFIVDGGVTQYKLNASSLDGDYALELIDGQARVKVDNTTIGLNGSGEIALQNISGASIAGNQVVKSLSDGSNIAQDDVTVAVNGTNGVDLSVSVNPTTDVLTISANANLAYLNANLSIPAGAVSWGGIGGTLSSQTDLITYIDDADNLRALLDTWYGNMRIVSAPGVGGYASAGLWLKSSGGVDWKLYVDDGGSLYVLQS